MIGLLLVAVGAGPLSGTADAAVPNTERVSVSGGGGQANGSSPNLTNAERPSISLHGRYVAFSSDATNLVAGDSNGDRDVFLRDRVAGTTQRVSVSSLGEQADGPSTDPVVSATGRYIAFSSSASNLVKRDTNGRSDVFVYDRTTGKTVRVSVRVDGGQANKSSFEPAISADGRHVAFVSLATNLVVGDTNNAQDVFVRDLAATATERVSVSNSGAQTAPVGRNSVNPSISGAGRYVAFQSEANNLVGDDPNLGTDVFIRDRTADTTERIGPYMSQVGMDVSFIEGGMDPSISADGRYVSYDNSGQDADGANGQHVYLHDRVADTTVRVTLAPNGDRGNGPSGRSSISADGRYVAFISAATNLVSGDSSTEDVFRWDRLTGNILRISVNTTGIGGNAESRSTSISGDGFHVAFGSWATNLVPGDTNGESDVFVRNLG